LSSLVASPKAEAGEGEVNLRVGLRYVVNFTVPHKFCRSFWSVIKSDAIAMSRSNPNTVHPRFNGLVWGEGVSDIAECPLNPDVRKIASDIPNYNFQSITTFVLH
jgi:hypothetical protein